jgi:hexosaminidase
MRLNASILIILLVFVSGTSHGTGNTGLVTSEKAVSVVPKPLSIKLEDGTFLLKTSTKVLVQGESKELHSIADGLAGRLRTVTGFAIPVEPLSSDQRRGDAIILQLAGGADLGAEGYRLHSSKQSVQIEGMKPSGVFYGVQTFYQLLPVEVEKKELVHDVTWSIPCLRIEDKPRFTWRGMHLDVGRHFFSKDSVKRYLDLMASYKMNTFHWHLTEDQGWRIEIKKYPRLTSIGSWRRETMDDYTPHAGFYTQDDIKEIVEYARERFITVVPEIEMPGHSQAALAAYPELSCSGGPIKVATEWGVHNDVYCAGNEKTFQFLEDVIGEVASLFPGPFFHIGGDECPKLRWSNCKRCQDRIAANGLNNEQGLQSYFIKRIEKMLNARGKRLVGWDEILEGGLAPNATVMSWRGIEGGIEAAKSGHDVVMTPTSYCYFDYYQAAVGEPAAIGGYLPIDSVYSYEPVPSEITSEQAKHVLGAQGNVWTEWIPNFRQVEYMAATRMAALSEVVWSDKSRRNFKDFLVRMTPQYQRLTFRDINFRVPAPLGVGGRRILFHDTLLVLNSPVPDASIYYTLDGQNPTPSSPRYSKPIPIHGDKIVTATLALPGGKSSTPLTTYFSTVDPKVNGVEYNYFEGVWEVLPDLRSMKPVKSGIAYDIGVESVPNRGEEYAVQFNCLVNITNDGDYTWYLGSDDGSKLSVDGKELIDNDGLHGLKEVSGKINLLRGKHKLEVLYFQRWGGQDLNVSLEGPGFPKQLLSPRLLLIQ